MIFSKLAIFLNLFYFTYCNIKYCVYLCGVNRSLLITKKQKT